MVMRKVSSNNGLPPCLHWSSLPRPTLGKCSPRGASLVTGDKTNLSGTYTEYLIAKSLSLYVR
jgi:hypothetical protein